MRLIQIIRVHNQKRKIFIVIKLLGLGLQSLGRFLSFGRSLMPNSPSHFTSSIPFITFYHFPLGGGLACLVFALGIIPIYLDTPSLTYSQGRVTKCHASVNCNIVVSFALEMNVCN